jgi:FtsZ-interacting cell division protein ZipA
MAISIAALLIAGFTSGKSMKKTVVEKINVVFTLKKRLSLRKTHDKKKEHRQSFTKKFVHRTKIGQPEQLKAQIKSQSIIAPSQIQRPYEPPQEPAQIPTTPNVLSSQSKQPDQTRKSQEIPPDCLVCPNLANCTQRQNRLIDSETPCPFAKKLNKSPFESQ